MKIAASGVCHTDLHAAEGDWPVKPSPPFISGHEGVGHVVAAGAGVRHMKEGDRAGVTVYKGLKVTDTQPDDWVVVSGIGGLGHLAVQYAKAMGLNVIAVKVDDAKLDLARSLGAALAVNARTSDPVAFVKGRWAVLRVCSSPRSRPRRSNRRSAWWGAAARCRSTACRRVNSRCRSSTRY